jgi:hypothetical protein
MRTFILGLGLVAGVALTAPAAADWQRSGQTTGPRGNSVQSEGKGSCANGRCEWSRESQGPRGNMATTSGSATRTAPGQWSSSATTTGSGGHSAKREGTFQVIR